MNSSNGTGSGENNDLPPDVEPDKAELHIERTDRVPIVRKGLGKKGQRIPLLTNHFKVNITNTDDHFYQYCVSLYYENGHPVDGKGIGRKAMNRVQETYSAALAGKTFAYDGEMSLFTLGPLPQNKFLFTVVLEDEVSSRNNGDADPSAHDSTNHGDQKRFRRQHRTKTLKVEISYATKVPLRSIVNALQGQGSEYSLQAVRVLDIILRQHAAKRRCLVVRQSFFRDNPQNLTDVGGGAVGCLGFYSSFRTSQGGLSLNIDVSTTVILRTGFVVDFLITNQGVKDGDSLDWAKAKRMLKNLRITTIHSNKEYKITGLSEKLCKDQLFLLKQRSGDGEVHTIEMTVYDYFVNLRNIQLKYSGKYPCIRVGRPKHPIYIPIELCWLVSLQRYPKSLTKFQRASLIEKSRQKPQERMQLISDELRGNNYSSEPMLRSCGITISSNFTQIEGRVLPAPKLIVGDGEDFIPRNGRWNFQYKKFAKATKIENWAVVNFSARCNVGGLVKDLMRVAAAKGLNVRQPFNIFEENPRFRRAPPAVRVDKMYEEVLANLPGTPNFLLCLLPDRKNSDIYGPWKKRSLTDHGIVTQCLCPIRVNDMFLANVLMKINAKLGGLNSLLSLEHSTSIPIESKVPTLILGMDVSHGSPGQSDIPSIAAVVNSRQWPLISRYRATVRTQSPKLEMIDSLFKKVSDEVDEGIIEEVLYDFYATSGSRKPGRIIIFRDGVGETQFGEVLNKELNQIMEACKFKDENWFPKFVVIVAQKKHHTRFFQHGSNNNVPPGTIVDTSICHPRNNDFYLCAHAGIMGTTRPTHYHVLLDQVGYSIDDLQELVHSLSYVYQRSSSAISVVAPISYAHLAASQVGMFMKFEDMSETSSSNGGLTSSDGPTVPQLPKIHDNVARSMFFV
ncbi:hypothetical protein SAY87_025533 [Trapa incisa]|uniref:Uncharacterized protein n=1 Tax=Trapa incisa TaxID=236973 RepID=A0AAN7GFZ6_9MYRT|nr:hypothetical protein SAY87_025533 [Trapa incisa]